MKTPVANSPVATLLVAAIVVALPLGSARRCALADVHSPRVLSQQVANASSMETSAKFPDWRFKSEEATDYTIDCEQALKNAFLPIAIAGDFGEQPLQGAADRNKQANQSKGTSKPNDANGKPTWIAAMRKVHSRFKGDPGVLALFGDSITISRAFWFGLPYTRKNAPPAMEADFRLVKQRMLKDCWDRKGPQFGNQGRMTIRWAHENVDSWLKKLNPEVALIMFGTNDLHQLKLDEYDKKMREVVKKCLDNGTVVILSTIPPRHGYAEKSAEFADAVRKIAREMRVPLTDYHAEILKRRPDDWDGKLDKFSDYQGFDVPTLIARDGVHPSNPKKYRSDYSAEGLEHNGFVLRNYLALTKYAEVIRQTLQSGQ